MSRTFIRRAGAAAAITALVSTTGAAFASQANAATDEPTPGEGKVVSNLALNIRHLPTTDAQPNGSLQPQAIVDLACKLNGETVDGNSIWYKLSDGSGWVTARYVLNLDPIPYCD